MSLESPDAIISRLKAIVEESSKGADALYEAEVAFAEAESEYEIVLQRAFIASEGTVADRTAVSRLKAAEARLRADLRKAEVNRIKQKLKSLELAQMSTQTIARQTELEFRFS